jgi:hypothetical protein
MTPRLLAAAACAAIATIAAGEATGQMAIRVGRGQPIATIDEAARRVAPGGTVEIEAGDYAGDVAVWDKPDVTIRAVNGPVRLKAGGVAAEGKGIFVVRADNIRIEGIEFSGARVSDRNGAGIRHEKGRLTVDRCRFLDNENGILSGNDREAELTVSHSEFGRNGAGDGRSHNLYVGTLKALTVSESYFHHARSGHLLKSRAARSTITYNRLADGPGGEASYELEFPAGGVAIVVGNVIEQSATTENSTVVSFGAEGFAWPRNELHLVNNTLVNLRPEGGNFLAVKGALDATTVANNILVGAGPFPALEPGNGNFRVTSRDLAPSLALPRASRLIGRTIDPGKVDGQSLRPIAEYVEPLGSRPVPRAPYNPGAFQTPAS